MTPRDQTIVLFGATGDLARRKLLPGIFHLFEAGLMPERFTLIGAARSALGDAEFAELAREAVCDSGRRPLAGDPWNRFAESLRFVSLGDGFERLGEAVDESRQELDDPQLLHYLSLPPAATAGVVEGLGSQGLGEDARVILEKPFGRDLVSARELDALVHSVFEEEQVFRIDHYLGREAVQNLLALRFANGMFEPVWNRNHIDHVQIDVPETLSIEMRGSFYEETGALRDMIVTHLFQVLSFVAMEPPTSLSAKALMLEREKVFDSMKVLAPGDVVRGQYAGYRGEAGVEDPDSDTETFVALRAFVDNWRWEGVPFFLRSGKRLAETHHLLTVAFSEPPRHMFPLDCSQVAEEFGHDHLTFELGDPGSISATFLAKVPGPKMQLGQAHMRFSYADSFGGPEAALDAYERLIHDVMVGDRTLFTTSAAIERLWEVADPIVREPTPVEIYEPGSWGPKATGVLIAPHRWHAPTDHP
jgi:glucose-6-phosphate 1-dehydrogenase